MPWKNGKGRTAEIAIHPAWADIQEAPFDWRVSLADVAEDGDFSAFPGYDRSIVLAAGKGMELSFERAPPLRLSHLGDAELFSGDWHSHCRLLDGPVRDFNVMTARGRYDHACDVVRGGSREFDWDPRQDTLICHCIAGELAVKTRGRAEWGLDPERTLVLYPDQGHPAEANIVLAPHIYPTIAVLVRLRPL
jgi:environmental stress-induced protein Ves